MNDATKRSILRSIHIVFGIPIIGYIYSPFKELPNYAPVVRFVFVPGTCPFGILDVERPCPSTTYFERIGLTRRCGEPPISCAIYGYGNISVCFGGVEAVHFRTRLEK